MYPDLHHQVITLLEKDHLSLTFHNVDDDKSHTKCYDTHVMGRFDCHNPECSSKGWSSKKICVTIRLYSATLYNARVYHQHCLGCDHLSRPLLDKASYAERVAYRLKKWKGVAVARPPFDEKKGPPHHSELCEGCKAGHCMY